MRFAVADEDGAFFVHENAVGECGLAVERFVAIGAVALFAVSYGEFGGGLFQVKTTDRM